MLTPAAMLLALQLLLKCDQTESCTMKAIAYRTVTIVVFSNS